MASTKVFGSSKTAPAGREAAGRGLPAQTSLDVSVLDDRFPVFGCLSTPRRNGMYICPVYGYPYWCYETPEDTMLSKSDLSLLCIAVDLKIASLKRGLNSSREPSFKVVYDSELRGYNALRSKLDLEVPHEVPQVDESRKK